MHVADCWIDQRSHFHRKLLKDTEWQPSIRRTTSHPKPSRFILSSFQDVYQKGGALSG